MRRFGRSPRSAGRSSGSADLLFPRTRPPERSAWALVPRSEASQLIEPVGHDMDPCCGRLIGRFQREKPLPVWRHVIGQSLGLTYEPSKMIRGTPYPKSGSGSTTHSHDRRRSRHHWLTGQVPRLAVRDSPPNRATQRSQSAGHRLPAVGRSRHCSPRAAVSSVSLPFYGRRELSSTRQSCVRSL